VISVITTITNGVVANGCPIGGEIVDRHGQPLLPAFRRPSLRFASSPVPLRAPVRFCRSSGSARFATSSMASHRCWRSSYEAYGLPEFVVDGKLRDASSKGLRELQENAAIFQMESQVAQ